MKRILLIRHAESANNALPESERVCDPGLTARGVEQARWLAECLATYHLPIAELYCSPFKRSLDTTLPVSHKLGLRPTIRADIYEQGGCYSGYEDGKLRGEPGMCCHALAERYPEWIIDPLIGPRGWNVDREYESYHEVQQRAGRVKHWLTADWQPKEQGGLAALVIHADFKRLLIAELLGSDTWSGFEQPIYNTAVSLLSYDETNWDLLTWNSADHLAAELRTPI